MVSQKPSKNGCHSKMVAKAKKSRKIKSTFYILPTPLDTCNFSQVKCPSFHSNNHILLLLLLLPQFLASRTFQMQKVPTHLPLAWCSPTMLLLLPTTETTFSVRISFGTTLPIILFKICDVAVLFRLRFFFCCSWKHSILHNPG